MIQWFSDVSKHDVTGFKFWPSITWCERKADPTGECVKHNLRVARFFMKSVRKSEKYILPENFTNCYVILLIHFMKIIWTGREKIPEIFAQLFDSSERRLSCMPQWQARSYDFSNLEDFSTSILLILPLLYGNPSFVKFRKKLGFRSYLCTKYSN